MENASTNHRPYGTNITRTLSRAPAGNDYPTTDTIATAHARLTATAELTQIQQHGGRNIPLPDPWRDAQHLLSKPTFHDNIKAYLQTFERTAELKGWPKHDKNMSKAIFLPLLTGEAQRPYFALPVEDYELLRTEILTHCKLFSTQAVLELHCWVYDSQVRLSVGQGSHDVSNHGQSN